MLRDGPLLSSMRVAGDVWAVAGERHISIPHSFQRGGNHAMHLRGAYDKSRVANTSEPSLQHTAAIPSQTVVHAIKCLERSEDTHTHRIHTGAYILVTHVFAPPPITRTNRQLWERLKHNSFDRICSPPSPSFCFP